MKLKGVRRGIAAMGLYARDALYDDANAIVWDGPGGPPFYMLEALRRLDEGLSLEAVGWLGADGRTRPFLKALERAGVSLINLRTVENRETVDRMLAPQSAGLGLAATWGLSANDGTLVDPLLDGISLHRLRSSTLALALPGWQHVPVAPTPESMLAEAQAADMRTLVLGTAEHLQQRLWRKADYAVVSIFDAKTEPSSHQAALLAAEALFDRGLFLVALVVTYHGFLWCSRDRRTVLWLSLDQPLQHELGVPECVAAGFLAGLNQNWDAQHVLKLACAAGVVASRQAAPLGELGSMLDTLAQAGQFAIQD